MRAWGESLGGITYPLLSDFWPHGKVAEDYGVLRAEGYSERAIFIVDKQGIIRYVDVHDIDEQPDNELLFRILGELEPVLAAAWAKETAKKEVPQSAEPLAPGVYLYCTSWCPDCKRARVWLADRGVNYQEINVTYDRPSAARLRGWARGNETTPTFDVRGTIIIGFDKVRLAEALNVAP